ncbi:MAG: hypothetical protein ACOWWO_14070 [Peptococcaceae bacterium]
MKRLYIWGLIVLIIFFSAACSHQNNNKLPAASRNNTQKEKYANLDDAVSRAIKDQSTSYALGETATEGHVILETKENDENIIVYTIASYGAFGFENGIFTKISGSGAIPTVITFSHHENSQYSLTEYKEPMDGSGYPDSIKKMFPQHLHSRVFAAHDDYPALAEQQEVQAEAYLKEIGRKARVNAGNVEKKLPDIDVQASNKLFAEFTKDNPFLNNCPYWLGTTEKVENGVRYIYETSQSKTIDGYDLITFQKKIEDGTIIEEHKYKIVENEPRLVDGEGEANSQSSNMQKLRAEYFAFGRENRLDYVPLFEEGKAPADSAEYLFYAFAINLDNWGDDKGIMTREYVEEVINSHFEVKNIIHSSLRKGWDYDGEKYIAVPQGIKEKPIYALQELTTQVQDDRTVYDIILDECNFGDVIPNEEDMVKIHASIVAGDLSALNVLRTERFKYYLDKNDTVVFLSHTKQ